MAYIDFRKLKERVSISDILDHYGLLEGLEETIQGLKGLCPFCGSNALKVSTEKNAWYCFGECKTNAKDDERYGGNILDLVARKEGVSVKRAAELIAGWFPPTEASRQSKKDSKKDVDEAKAKEPEGREATREDPAVETQEPAEEWKQPEDDGAGQGGEVSPAESLGDFVEGVAPVPRERAREPDLTGLRNMPLDFTLKSIDVEHTVLASLGLRPQTLQTFEVGYFTGKGSMAGRVVLPFHNADGLLVAYAGYSPKDRSIRFPKRFDPQRELYNAVRADIAQCAYDGLVLVTELLNVLRLYELDVHRVVGLPSDTIHPPQLAQIRRLLGAGGRRNRLAPCLFTGSSE